MNPFDIKINRAADGRLEASSIQSLFAAAQQNGMFEGYDRQSFSQLLNQATNSDIAGRGTGGAIGFGTQVLSEGLDATLEWLGVNEVGRAVGETVGGWLGDAEVGRQVGGTLPRQAVNMLPLMIPGVGPIVGGLASAGLAGSDVYTQTGELDRAALAGATSAAAPLVIGKMFPAIAGAIPGGAALGEKLTSNLIGGVAARFGGNLLEGGVFGVAQDIGDILLSEDRKLSEMGTEKYWVQQGVGALAFAPFDAVQAYKAQVGMKAQQPTQTAEFQRQFGDDQIPDPVIAPPKDVDVIGNVVKEPIVPPEDVLVEPEDFTRTEKLFSEPVIKEDSKLEAFEPDDVARLMWEAEMPTRSIPELVDDGIVEYATMPLEEVQDKIPQSVDEVKVQLETVNSVREMVDVPPVTDAAMQAVVEKQVEMGEDTTQAVLRATQELKNKTQKLVENKKVELSSVEAPEEARPLVAALEELGTDKKFKGAVKKALTVLAQNKWDGEVVLRMGEEFGQWKKTLEETGMGSVGGLENRIKNVREMGRRRKNSNESEGPQKVGRKSEGVAKMYEVFDKVENFSDKTLKTEVMYAYNDFVQRMSKGVEEADVQSKAVNVLDAWLKSGSSDAKKLKGMLSKAGDDVQKERARTRARRGLVDDGESVWQDVSMHEAELLADEHDPIERYDAMRLNAAQNMEMYWNAPQYVVQANGQVKFGKLLSDKKGLVDAKALETVLGFNNKPVKGGELELWKQIVPKAWEGEKVNLHKLVRGLENAEPTVELKVLGGEGVKSFDYERVNHELETLGYFVEVENDNTVTVNGPQGKVSQGELPQNVRDLVEQYQNAVLAEPSYEQADTIHARYSWLGAKHESDMPGYVEGLVRLPLKHDSPKGDDRVKLNPAPNEDGRYRVENMDGTLVDTRSTLEKAQKFVDDINRGYPVEAKFKGPHFGEHDRDVVGFFRGYMEGDTFHVMEVQSDWGQANRKNRAIGLDDMSNAPNHPLLDIYNSLALKAAIQHAQKAGATKIALSDAETAMMTEGHDQGMITSVWDNKTNQKHDEGRFGWDQKMLDEANVKEPGRYEFRQSRPTQEAGMRLNYDSILPKELERLTGSKGEPIDFGQHRTTESDFDYSQQQAFESYDQQALTPTLKGSPVFNNKTNATGLVYPLDKLSSAATYLFGDRGQRTLTRSQQATEALLAHGETPGNAQVLTNAVVRVAEAFEQFTGKDIAIGRIDNAKGVVSGLALQSDVARRVFLDPETHPQLQGFVAAHEMFGHVFHYLHQAGRLEPSTSLHYQRMLDGWTQATPDQRFGLLRQMSDMMMPKDWKDQMDSIFERSSLDYEESLANLQGMMAYGYTSKFDSSMLKYLPQPIVSVMIDFGRWFKRVINASKTVLGYRRLTERAPAELLTSIKSFDNHMTSVLKSFVDLNNSNGRIMQRWDQLMPGGLERFVDAGVVDATGLKLDRNKAIDLYDAFTFKELKDGLSHFADPILHQMERYPFLRTFSNVMRNEQGVAHALMRKGQELLFADGYKNGRPVVLKNGGSVGEVIRDSTMTDALHEIVIQQLDGNYGILSLSPNDPRRQQALAGLTAEQQKHVLETLSRLQTGNIENQKAIIDSRHRRAQTDLATLIRDKVPGTNEEVRKIAQGLYETFRVGRATQNFQQWQGLINQFGLDPKALGDWSEKVINKIAEAEQFFQSRPWFVTTRRFKRYQVSFKESTGDNGFASFDTPDQAAAFVEQVKTQGGKVNYPRTGYKDSFEKYGNLQKAYDSFEQSVLTAEEKVVQPLYDQMLASKQINQATYDALVKSRDEFRSAMSSDNLVAEIGQTTPSRKKRAGEDMLNMIEQHILYTHKLAKALPRMETNGELRFAKMDPAIIGDAKSWETLMRAEKGLEVFRRPDTTLGNKIAKGMFGWYMGMNLSSALIEATQAPLSLAPMLAAEGAGTVRALALPFEAASKIAKFNVTQKWDSGVKVIRNGKATDAYEALIGRGEREGWIGLGLQQEIHQMDHEAMLDLGNLSVGKEAKGKGWMSTVIGQYMNLSTKLYGAFAAYNEKISFISAFDLKKEQLFGKKDTLTSSEFEQVYQEATRIVTIANNNAGRIDRPVGWFDTEGQWRTASQAMYSLGSYNAGALSNLWRYVRHGMKNDIAGLPPQQQKDARRAAVMAFGGLVSAAGLIGGIPFMGPLVALMDEYTDWEAERTIREGAFKLGEEFAGKEGGTFVADWVTHGGAYAAGLPVDISSRVAMNGILGFNAYEGWSPKALLGPIGGVGDTVGKVAENVLQGDLTRAVENGMPPAFRRLYGLWANDGAVTDRKGKTTVKPTLGEQVALSIGFTPSRIGAWNEAQRLQYKADRARQDRNDRLHRDVAKDAKQNPAKAQAQLKTWAQENPGYNEAAGVNSVVDYLTRERFGYDLNRAGTLGNAADNQHILDTFGEKFGPGTSEVDYYRERVKLGAMFGQVPQDVHGGLLQAALVDQLVKSRGLTVPSARALASAFVGSDVAETAELAQAFLR